MNIESASRNMIASIMAVAAIFLLVAGLIIDGVNKPLIMGVLLSISSDLMFFRARYEGDRQ